MCASAGYAQNASVTGRVTDPTNAAVSDVKVTLINTGTNLPFQTNTNDAGIYSLPDIPTGTYRMELEKNGFKSMAKTGIIVHVHDTLEINLQMTLGSLAQTITVGSTESAVQLTNATISAVVNSTEVLELPLNGRDWTQLATLQPGVVSAEAYQISPTISQRGFRGYGAQLPINGNRPQQNGYLLDGINIDDYTNSGPGSVTSGSLGVDAIQEFSVLTSNYSAEFGRTSGGVISAVSRSGTNNFHGDAYEFVRNSALDARNFFDGPSIPAFQRNQFGASAGGPIQKDKTFIYGDYEGLRQSQGITQIDTVPSQDARNGTIHNQDGTTTTIPIGPGVQSFLAVYPLPNGAILSPGNVGLYSFVSNQGTTENFATVRVDHRFSMTDSLFGSYQFDKASLTLPDTLNNIFVSNDTSRQFVTIQETHIFTPQLLNSVRFGFNRSTAHLINFLNAINPAAADPSLGAVPGRNAPAVIVPGLTQYNGGLGSTTYARFFYNSFQGYDDLFLTKGIHSLKLGFAVERIQDNMFEDPVGGGEFIYGSLNAFLGNESSYFLTGLPSPLNPRGLRQTIFGGYIQDDVRLRPNLTVNLGLRYEMATVISEVQGRLSNLRSITGNVPFEGSPLYSNPTLRNFEPRVGFSWDPFHNGKTAVRGGFGMFDVLPLPYEIELPEIITYPWNVLEFNVHTLPGSFPSGAYSGLQLTDVTTTYIEPHPKRNYVMQWNLNIQRELAPNLTATLAYVGNRGVHNSFTEDNANWVYPTVTPAGYLWPTPIGSGTLINPLHSRIDSLTWPSNSFYDALEFQVLKRISHGFQIQGSYTWGKSIDQGSTSIAGDQFTNSILNLFPFNANLRRALSDFNVAQNLVINYTWTIPSPKSLTGAAEWATSGWQVGGIFEAQTGLPFTPIIGGDPLGQNTGDAFDTPDRLRGVGCGSGVNPGNVANYIKLSCFALPMATPAIASQCVPFSAVSVPGTCQNLLGNAGRNSLIGPGLTSLDFSIFKNNYIKKFGEQFNVQFRAEFFNILNHANFQSPIDNSTLFDQTGAPIAGAGRIDATTTSAREIQFAIKVYW
jgi:hypothetical protein